MQHDPDKRVINVYSIFLTIMGINRGDVPLSRNKVYNWRGCVSWEEQSEMANVCLRPLSELITY